MRHYFLDTSALVKLYAMEPGYKRVRDMVRSASVSPPSGRVLVCDLVHPEAASALIHILQGPSPAQRGLGKLAERRLAAELVQDLGPDATIYITQASGVIRQAADLAWKHRIRGADAVHVAAALAARNRFPRNEEFYFVGSDKQQNAVAAAEGLDVIDPTA